MLENAIARDYLFEAEDFSKRFAMYHLHTLPPLSRPFKYGIGFNWFEHLGSGGLYGRNSNYSLAEPVHPEPGDELAWAALEQGLDELMPGFIRYGIPPDPHVRSDGSFESATIHLRRLAKLDLWAQQKGCAILLDTFTMPRYFEFPLPEGASDVGSIYVNMAAENNVRYAEMFVAPLLRYIVEKGMESVRFFNPINEPMEYGVYQTPKNGPEVYSHYVDMFRQMRQALDQTGIPRTRIGLVGIDGSAITYPLLEFFSRNLDIDPYVDAYSRHFYNLRFDYLPPAEGSWTSTISDVLDRHAAQVIQYAHHRGKPLLVTEIGTFYYGWRNNNPSGAASVDAVFTVAEGVIRGLNAGADCFAFWSLMNPNTIDGRWSVLEIKNSQLVRCGHPFAVYGMLARAVRPGSTVYPLMNSSVRVLSPLHGSLLKRPDGSWVALIINDDPVESHTVHIALPPEAIGGDWSVFVVDRVCLNEKRPSIPVDSNRCLRLCVPAFSLVALYSQTP